MNEKRNREELITQRNLLFARFLQSPMDIHLAGEIKIIDDQIAESTERMRAEDRKTERREARKCADSKNYSEH